MEEHAALPRISPAPLSSNTERRTNRARRLPSHATSQGRAHRLSCSLRRTSDRHAPESWVKLTTRRRNHKGRPSSSARARSSGRYVLSDRRAGGEQGQPIGSSGLRQASTAGLRATRRPRSTLRRFSEARRHGQEVHAGLGEDLECSWREPHCARRGWLARCFDHQHAYPFAARNTAADSPTRLPPTTTTSTLTLPRSIHCPYRYTITRDGCQPLSDRATSGHGREQAFPTLVWTRSQPEPPGAGAAEPREDRAIGPRTGRP